MTLRRCIHGRTERQQCAACDLFLLGQGLFLKLRETQDALKRARSQSMRLKIGAEIQDLEQKLQDFGVKKAAMGIAEMSDRETRAEVCGFDNCQMVECDGHHCLVADKAAKEALA